MPTSARNQIVREGEIATYHCWSRCVQRAFLCGEDTYTGRNYDYRREWIEQLVKYQAGVFAVDVANHNVLSNHMHLVTRTRPDIVATWSDEEVACRWKLAWPEWDGTQWSRRPTDDQIHELLLDAEKLALARWGLSSLSWFMARCKEPIARLANSEMETSGHFWEQRFGCREIADEAALLTCMVYVDVNQVRAGLAPSLDQSHCSGIAARLAAWRAREAQASYDEFHRSRTQDFGLSLEQIESLLADSWLAPIGDTGPLMTDSALRSSIDASHASIAGLSGVERTGQGATPARDDSGAAPACDDTGRCTGDTDGEGYDGSRISNGEQEVPLPDRANHTIYERLFDSGRCRRRASDSPILPMPFSQYREIVQWVADQVSRALGRPPSIPTWLEQWLRNRGTDPDHWWQAVEEFQDCFGRAVGSVVSLRQLLDRTGGHWVHGVRRCQVVFG